MPDLREDTDRGSSKRKEVGVSWLCLHNFTLCRAICQLTEQAKKPLSPSEGNGQNNVFSCFSVSHRDWVPQGVCETLSNPLVAGDKQQAGTRANLLQGSGTKAMATYLTLAKAV